VILFLLKSHDHNAKKKKVELEEEVMSKYSGMIDLLVHDKFIDNGWLLL